MRVVARSGLSCCSCKLSLLLGIPDIRGMRKRIAYSKDYYKRDVKSTDTYEQNPIKRYQAIVPTKDIEGSKINQKRLSQR
jgi:hypothetical protein